MNTVNGNHFTVTQKTPEKVAPKGPQILVTNDSIVNVLKVGSLLNGANSWSEFLHQSEAEQTKKSSKKIKALTHQWMSWVDDLDDLTQ